MHYIYKITNQLNKKIYLGQTMDVHKRWQAHKSYAKKPEITGQYIHRAMAKYGVENFIYEVIDFATNQWQADCIEKSLISFFDTRNLNKGYNLASGGNVFQHSKESIRKMSESKRGHKVSKETREQISSSLVGIHTSPQTEFQPGQEPINKGKKMTDINPNYRHWNVGNPKGLRANSGSFKSGHGSKLSDNQKMIIRQDPRTSREIAVDYGVDHTTISKIKRKK